jgi:NAD(P)-dependent dehydrogenase (short-subunit alcohol dehydrogenase family)
LGLALARGFARAGCSLILCARDESELRAAEEDLCRLGADVLTVPCDVAERAQVKRLVELSLRRFGRIDVLVNNAGVIQVGPIHTMTMEDFETAMGTMFWGTVNTTLAVLRQMQELGEGRIVNITSVGGKVSVPHLIPYSCAKFAAVAFSEGLRAELQGTGIKVVTIAPGLMRTGSFLNSRFKGDDDGEAAWFSVSASLPGLSMSATRAASQIIAATRAGDAEKILSLPANLLARLGGLFPGMVSDVLGLVNRVLPQGEGAYSRSIGNSVAEKPWLRAMTTLGRQAARRFLQPGTAPVYVPAGPDYNG